MLAGLVKADDRFTDILKRCSRPIRASAPRELVLDATEELTGRPFSPDTFA
jgi:hypothetical protein